MEQTSRPAELRIRPAKLSDAAEIAEIYNEAILTTTATFDVEVKTAENRAQWISGRGARFPVLVAEVDGRVVGWSALSRWSDRKAYDQTAETSFYVLSGFRGQGIGRHLKRAIIAEARRLDFHTLIARVAEGSDASVHINQQAGFVLVGVLKEVGFKFGRRLDVYIMQKMLHDHETNEKRHRGPV